MRGTSGVHDVYCTSNRWTSTIPSLTHAHAHTQKHAYIHTYSIGIRSHCYTSFRGCDAATRLLNFTMKLSEFQAPSYQDGCKCRVWLVWSPLPVCTHTLREGSERKKKNRMHFHMKVQGAYLDVLDIWVEIRKVRGERRLHINHRG